ncbi:MAG: DMT family transporter, partial [Synergistes sp.]|nr:DMT family transporter [Synergistes sp.]
MTVKYTYMRGALYSTLAAVLWGVMSPVAKIISNAGISMITTVLLRSAFASVMMFVCFAASHKLHTLRATKSELKFYFTSALLTVAFASCGYMTSLEYLTVAEAIVLHYTFPIVTLVAQYFVTGEKPTVFQIIAGVFVVFGVYSGMGGSVASMTSLSPAGIAYAVLSIVGMSGQALIARNFSMHHKLNPFTLLFYSNVLGFFMILLYKSSVIGWGDMSNMTPFLLLLVAAMALTGTIISYALFYEALKIVPAVVVTLLCTLEIVVAVCLSAFMVEQIPSYGEVAGCALIILSAVFTTVSPDKAL